MTAVASSSISGTIAGGKLLPEAQSCARVTAGRPKRRPKGGNVAQLSKPGSGEQVVADELKFLDRSRTRAYVVEECVTSG
jgi:hypothetical protein